MKLTSTAWVTGIIKPSLRPFHLYRLRASIDQNTCNTTPPSAFYLQGEASKHLSHEKYYKETLVIKGILTRTLWPTWYSDVLTPQSAVYITSKPVSYAGRLCTGTRLSCLDSICIMTIISVMMKIFFT